MEPVQPDEGDEAASAENLGSGAVSHADDAGQFLFVPTPHRQDDDAALRQLGDPGLGDGRRCGGGEDAVEGRMFGRPQGAVSDDEPDSSDLHLRETPPRVFGEGRDPLDRHQFAAEARENRRLVPRPGPDLEDLLRTRKPERGRHLGDDVRLGDRLSLSDGERFVGVREVPELLRDEEVTRHLFHRRKHAFVADPPAAHLFLHHAAAEDGLPHQVHFRKARIAAKFVRSRWIGVTEMNPSSIASRSEPGTSSLFR